MNIALFIITLAFLLFSLILLLVPFYPTWKEWKYPSDDTALAFSNAASQTPERCLSKKLAHVCITKSSANQGDVVASDCIEVGAGCRFQRLDAPTLFFGKPDCLERMLATFPQLTVLNPSNATRWGKNGWRIVGDFHIPNASFYEGALIVTGTLTVGDDCLIRGDLKARQGLQVG